MLSAIELINSAKASQSPSSTLSKVVVDLHPSRPEFRGVKTPYVLVSLEADPSFEEIEAAGGTVEKNAEAHEILGGYFLVSGEIPRETGYENGIQGGVRYEGEEKGWVEDQEIRDERFVVCHVNGKFKSLLVSHRDHETDFTDLGYRQRSCPLYWMLPRRRHQCCPPRPSSHEP